MNRLDALLQSNSRTPGLPAVRHQVVATVASGAGGKVAKLDQATATWSLATPASLREVNGVAGLIVAPSGSDWLIQIDGVTARTKSSLTGSSGGNGRLYTVDSGGVLTTATRWDPIIASELPDGRLQLFGAAGHSAWDTVHGTWTWYTSGSGTHNFTRTVTRYRAIGIGAGGEATAATRLGYIASTSGGGTTLALDRPELSGGGGGAFFIEISGSFSSVAYSVGAAPGGGSYILSGSTKPTAHGGSFATAGAAVAQISTSGTVEIGLGFHGHNGGSTWGGGRGVPGLIPPTGAAGAYGFGEYGANAATGGIIGIFEFD